MEVSGKHDVNAWYAYNGHSKTAVHTETLHYKDRVKLHFRDEEAQPSNEVFVTVYQQPNCMETVLSACGEKLEVTVEREIHVELMGETKCLFPFIRMNMEKSGRILKKARMKSRNL